MPTLEERNDFCARKRDADHQEKRPDRTVRDAPKRVWLDYGTREKH